MRETADVQLDTESRQWALVVGDGENPELDLLDLFDVTEAEEWQDRALCKETDPESFFPDKGGTTREAKQTCMACEVKADCLQYALENDIRWGIWGGVAERDRRKLKKANAARQAAAVAEAA